MKGTNYEIQTEGKIQVNLMTYKTLIKGSYELFERLAYQTRKSDEN